MTEQVTAYPATSPASRPAWLSPPTGLAIALMVAVALLTAHLGLTFHNMSDDDPRFAASTLGELAVWMADQSSQESPVALLGQLSRGWALERGLDQLEPAMLSEAMRVRLAQWYGLLVVAAAVGLAGLVLGANWTRPILLCALLGLSVTLFIIPPLDGDPTLSLTLLGMVGLLVALLLAPGRVTKVLGFFVVLASLLVVWEGSKAFAESVGYAITAAQPAWQYTTYETLDDALTALQAGQIDALLYEQRDLREQLPAAPLADGEDPQDSAWSDLRWLRRFQSDASFFGLTMRPAMPGRLAVAVRAEDTERITGIDQLTQRSLATIAGEFAEERYLALPREVVLIDLKILNDLNLPHLQNIARAFLQPARRNGPLLLVRILWEAGLYTWGEAVYGFALGASLGFALGVLFAHSRLMERGLLPYVVASQTVPILAIAPMVVIWLGAGPLAVSVIAAYITFFPVTINTLRGLRSPSPMALELMQSYAASAWAVMWKLRFPAALPYIFTALKVSATASVVGAIIGELPSSIRDGLGRAILDFSSDYSLVSTPKLWAAIVMAAIVGISFFIIVSIAEWFVLRRYVREA